MSAAAKACGGRICRLATACTNPRTGAKKKTWSHLGLRDGQQFGSIIVDPKNPDRLFVAVLGHPYGPSAERGIFRSLDGGQSFTKVLFKNDDVAESTSPSIHAIATRFTHRLGVAASALDRGRELRKVRGADCSNPKTGRELA